ncbi:transcriptional regulator, TetR family [Dehalobacter sp. UNSWDHB]|uniref:TetR/AcrR family transcriptional regulator n=1 Tax=unclassified Dehalobacter TaxID=2635733 RepID=UPI0003877975|nr:MULTISPECIES: TetR family transcriptional regulator [unclassified Dehalobacter]EQB20342.1 transcriptional regulator, TetR family [Dehalobacter sp. UNSWDHB]RJE47633.1 TetR family transcriptional regulator [Dehalobacter sp. MCB1]
MTKERKKTEILLAASKVFYIKGFEGTKIDDVAKEAGIGKGTVYEYFESKKQLFEETVVFSCEERGRIIQEILEKGSSLEEKIRALAKCQAEMIREHMPVVRMMSCSKIMAREMGAVFIEHNIRLGEIIKKQVRQAIDQGEARAEIDPEFASAAIMGTIMQYFGKKVIFAEAMPEEADYDKIVQVLMSGIGMKPDDNRR